MELGPWITKSAIWFALLRYFGAQVMELRGRGVGPWGAAQVLWSVGWVAYLAHVAAAFHVYHGWSHAVAAEHTAIQTEALIGWHWAGGIWINYAFTLAWGLDVLWQWLAARRDERTPVGWRRVWHGFLFFMVINGTVVFGHGPVRWLGAVGCGLLAGLWWMKRGEA